MCKCGCNTCETKTKGPLLTEGKVKSLLSEGLQYHIDKKIPLFETVYRIGSDKHLALIKEARKMYSRNVIDLCEEDEALIKTNLGEFALYEGVSIPLDLPMISEQMDLEDELANEEFGMDYDQLGSGEKEWVRDEINNMSMNESTSKKYEYIVTKDDWKKSKFPFDKLKNSEFKIRIAGEGKDQSYMLFWKEGGLEDWEWEAGSMTRQLRSALMAIAKRKLPINTSESINESYDYDEVAQSEFGMDYDQLGSGEKEWVRDEIDNMSMNESNSNYPDFDLNKNIRYQDTVITNGMWRYTGRESGGAGVYRNLNNDQFLAFDRNEVEIFRKNLSSHFDFSESLNENEDKLLKIKQELEALRPGTISWIDDIFISSYDGSLQVELDYTLYPDEIKQLAQIAAKYGMELKYMTGKNATLVKRIDEAVKNALTEKKAKKKEKKDPPLNKPKRGGSKAYYVYVRDPKTKKIKKVSFGSGGLRAKIKNKEARNAFAARHNCKNKKDRTKAGYWSCNLPRYAPALGLGAKMNTFW